jgi:hypothetical protein
METSTPSRWAFVLVATVALLSAKCGVQPDWNAPDLAYSVTTINERQHPHQPPQIDTTVVTEQFAGGNTRLAFVHVPARFAGDTNGVSLFGLGRGEYMVERRGGSVTTVIDTGKKHYFMADMAAMSWRFLGDIPNSVIHPGDTVFAVRVQPDTILDGMRAEHWRVTDNHTVTDANLPTKLVATEHETIDQYVVKELAAVPGEGFGLMPRQPLTSIAYYRELNNALAQVPRGLSVLTIKRNVWVWGEDGSQYVETSSQRISGIRRDPIPLDAFAVPAGYARVAAPTLPTFPSRHSGRASTN